MKPFVVTVFVVLFLSCQKKSNSPDPAANNSSSTGGSTSGGLSPSVGGDYCNLQTTYTYNENNGIVSKDSFVVASFYSAPVSSVAPTNIPAGTVSLNGSVLSFNSGTNLYSSVSGNSISIGNTLNWQVSGSGTVTAFSQSFTPSYPVYTGASSLPDTIRKSTGATITINGVSNNQNSVTIWLRDMNNASSNYKFLIGSNGSVTFVSGDLSSLTAGQPVFLTLNLANTYSVNHGGILRGFANTISYTKRCYLKP
jgi:hypothetical protein